MIRRFKPLVWPLALLIVGAITALIAETAAWSETTANLYGLIKITSDLTLLIGGGWGFVALGRIFLVRPEEPPV